MPNSLSDNRPVAVRFAIGLVLAVGVIGTLLTFHRAPHAFFYMDDFIGIQEKGNLWLLAVKPYSGHVSFLTGSIWVLWLQLFGTQSYAPYLALACVLTTTSALALTYLVARISTWSVGSAAGVWVIFLGPAFHNQLWDQASLQQIAPISLAFIALLLRPVAATNTRCWVAVGVAIVSSGTGGLGFGVLVATSLVLIWMRRYKQATFGFVTAAVLVLIGQLSGGSFGSDVTLVSRVERVPGYVLLAYQTTFQSSFGLPEALAGGAASLFIVALIAGGVAARREFHPPSARTAVLAFGYLIVTWSTLGFTRGISDEVAAPRYLGVTGPVLLLLILATCVLLWQGARQLGVVSDSKWLVTYLCAVAIMFIGAAVLTNLQVWLVARSNANYLGTLNLARLAALHDGRSWIPSGYSPPGEGLKYVKAGLIEEAWRRHGLPPLSSSDITNRPWSVEASTALVEVAVNAGVVRTVTPSAGTVVRSGDSVRSKCRLRQTAHPPWRFRVRRNSRNLALSLKALSSVPVEAPLTEGGVKHELLLRPMPGTGRWLIETSGGCLFNG